MMKIFRFALPFFLVSFLISLLLLIGRIDQDFFAFYYGGRAIVWSQPLYAAVAENKGPVTYLFFAALYWIFQHQYGGALILASTLLDGLSSMLLFILVQRWLHWTPPHRTWIRLGIIAAMVIYLKSFSINSLQGGIYSEQVGLPILLFSLLLVEKQRLFGAGLSFGLAVMTRQSLIYYLLFIGIRFFMQKRRAHSIVRFLAGTGIIIGGGAFILWYIGQGYWAFENMILSVFWHSRATAPHHWYYVLRAIFREFRLLFALIFVGAFLIKQWKALSEKHALLTLLGLIVSGAGSVFAGALVWDHHFLQLAPAFVVCLVLAALFLRGDYILQFFVAVLTVSVLVGYIGYVTIGTTVGARLTDTLPRISELEEKRYLVVYPLYPRLYVDYDKEAPDRYYDPSFSLSKYYFGDSASLAISRHLAMDLQKVRTTAFVFLSSVDDRDKEYEWYLQLIRGPFHLEKQADYVFGRLQLEVYVSTL